MRSVMNPGRQSFEAGLSGTTPGAGTRNDATLLVGLEYLTSLF